MNNWNKIYKIIKFQIEKIGIFIETDTCTSMYKVPGTKYEAHVYMFEWLRALKSLNTQWILQQTEKLLMDTHYIGFRDDVIEWNKKLVWSSAKVRISGHEQKWNTGLKLISIWNQKTM